MGDGMKVIGVSEGESKGEEMGLSTRVCERGCVKVGVFVRIVCLHHDNGNGSTRPSNAMNQYPSFHIFYSLDKSSSTVHHGCDIFRFIVHQRNLNVG